MLLQAIGEDILLEILSLCDIYVVLLVSTVGPITDHRKPIGANMTRARFIAQVNKFFRRVALSKQL
jgi:hypothetical protein